MLAFAHGWAIGDAHTHGAKRAASAPFVPWPPRDTAPRTIGQNQGASWPGSLGTGLAWTPTTSIRPYRQRLRRVDLLRAWDADRPSQAARAQTLPERAEAVSGIGQYVPRSACRLRRRGRSRPTRSRAWSATRAPPRSTGRSTASVVISPDLRHERTRSAFDTSWRANVSETSDWQLACLPSSPQYCGTTPTDTVPFFGMPVSSITSASARQATDPPARPAPATAARRPRRRW